MASRSTDFLGRGWGFPVKPGPGGRLRYASGPEKVEQSIWLILGTAPGERVMRPRFGAGIHSYVFRPNDAATRGALEEAVRGALTRWEPRIDVLNVRVEQDLAAAERVLIHIDYRLRTNNAIYNLVYPFFLNESGG